MSMTLWNCFIIWKHAWRQSSFLALAALGLLATGAAQAQESPLPEVRRAIQAVRATNSKLIVKIDKRTGLPSSISGLAIAPDATRDLGASAPVAKPKLSPQTIRRAAETFFTQGALSAAFNQTATSVRSLQPPPRPDPDFPDRFVTELEQHVKGVPVFGSRARVTVDNTLAVTGLTASFSGASVSTTEPAIQEDEAIDTARAKLTAIQAQPRLSSPGREFSARPNPATAIAKAQLVVFDPKLLLTQATGDARLAYLVSIGAYRIFVDAQNGEVLNYFRDQHSAMARRVFDLATTQNFPGKQVVNEPSSSTRKTLPRSVSPDAKLAFTNAGLVMEFYRKKFGRLAVDRRDATTTPPASSKFMTSLDSYVRFGDLQNAYWCPSVGDGCPKAKVMVYGPGYASAIDVVGHEMTHGIIEHEANLVYTDEPGAVNEALADIFGTLIEFDAKGAQGNWLMGETLQGFSVAQPLRDMSNPHMAATATAPASGLVITTGSTQPAPTAPAPGATSTGAAPASALVPAASSSAPPGLFDKSKDYNQASNRGQPDHFDEYVTRTDPLCGDTYDADVGCVHFNSGIFNKFAYLISEGGTHRGVSLSGIGLEKLGRLAYRALTVKLNSTTGLQASADAFVESCSDFASANKYGFAAADCASVQLARDAVGLTQPTS